MFKDRRKGSSSDFYKIKNLWNPFHDAGLLKVKTSSHEKIWPLIYALCL